MFLTGEKIGRWTVLDKYTTTGRNERKWLCRCECGTERYVLERSLKYGGSLSCGCAAREKTVSYDLSGKTFGCLRVTGKAENQRKNGGVWWSCICSCGNTVDYPATLLVTGKRTSCGCKTAKRTNTKDISNQIFNSITALYATDRRDKKGNVIWHCRCNDCGTELDLSYNELLYTNRKSCGCKKRRHSESLPGLLTHVAGTSIDMLRSEKLPVNNTTGHKGVYYIKGKYTAKIVFQKKAYYLGNYEKYEDAVAAREDAEKLLLQGTLEHYSRWKERAQTDTRWADENPIQIKVAAGVNSRLRVQFLPEL
ncbi:MAG: hypothetical protein IJ410_02725 [Oscillospiraceae bacterium]|nr:hypothetical protein [Oscillospiraceae bacterium]